MVVMTWRWVWDILRKPDRSCRMSSGVGLHFWIFIGGRFCQPLKAAFEQNGNL